MDYHSTVPPRVVIKDCSTELFYLGLDQWTLADQKALAFTTVGEAAQVIRRAALKNVTIVKRP